MSGKTSNRLDIAHVRRIFEGSPFIAFLGVEAEALDHDRGEFAARLPLRPELERRKGTEQFHGGPIVSFIDIVGDIAIGMLVGGGVPTANLRVDYLRPATGAGLRGLAKVRRAGKTLAVVDIDVTDDQGRLVAVGRGTYMGAVG